MPCADATWRKFGKAIAESRKAGEEAESYSRATTLAT